VLLGQQPAVKSGRGRLLSSPYERPCLSAPPGGCPERRPAANTLARSSPMWPPRREAPHTPAPPSCSARCHQTLALQRDALTAGGCDRIFTDIASGSRTDRPGLAQALSYVRNGDTLVVVWRLDRLGRSLA
jgi:hypothetical protein